MISVHFESIDDKNPYAKLRSIRRIKITTEKGEMVTPARAATDFEFKQKQHLPTDVELPNLFVTNSLWLNGDELQGFLDSNKNFRKASVTIQAHKDMQHHSSSLFNFILTRSGESKSLPAMRREASRRSFLNAIKDIQIEKEIPNISVPYLDLPFSEYKSELRLFKNAVEKGGSKNCIVPIIDMQYEKFRELLKYCVDDLSISAISVPYREFESAGPRYYDIRDYDTKDVAFFIIHVNRSIDRNLSTMHYLPFRIGDVFSIKYVQGGIRPKKGETKEEFEVRTRPNLAKLKLFLRSSLLIDPVPQILRQWNRLGNKVIEELGAEDKATREIVSNFEKSDQGRDMFRAASALTRVHELKASTQELASFEDAIRKNDSGSYVEKKPVLGDLLNRYMQQSL